MQQTYCLQICDYSILFFVKNITTHYGLLIFSFISIIFLFIVNCSHFLYIINYCTKHYSIGYVFTFATLKGLKLQYKKKKKHNIAFFFNVRHFELF